MEAYSIALAVLLPIAVTVIVAMVTILIIIVKQLRNVRYYNSSIIIIVIAMAKTLGLYNRLLSASQPS